ncbi:Hypothetical protein, putative [Bodo saltans]|uniref:Uncharacterized protein n=1 Tax=Bodo saltans TaxID=75058 RepID=A0A0S4JP14_BODSA|nr:Hypothetical protein, putative [Bodo saltans]|eukprot:CUG91006.1 Hypothetical protein, putative [Bodo saltans]
MSVQKENAQQDAAHATVTGTKEPDAGLLKDPTHDEWCWLKERAEKEFAVFKTSNTRWRPVAERLITNQLDSNTLASHATDFLAMHAGSSSSHFSQQNKFGATNERVPTSHAPDRSRAKHRSQKKVWMPTDKNISDALQVRDAGRHESDFSAGLGGVTELNNQQDGKQKKTLTSVENACSAYELNPSDETFHHVVRTYNNAARGGPHGEKGKTEFAHSVRVKAGIEVLKRHHALGQPLPPSEVIRGMAGIMRDPNAGKMKSKFHNEVDTICEWIIGTCERDGYSIESQEMLTLISDRFFSNVPTDDLTITQTNQRAALDARGARTAKQLRNLAIKHLNSEYSFLVNAQDSRANRLLLRNAESKMRAVGMPLFGSLFYDGGQRLPGGGCAPPMGVWFHRHSKQAALTLRQPQTYAFA